MAPRPLLGCVATAVLALAACKDKAATPAAAALDKPCELVAAACGDKDKHVEKIGGECKALAKTHADKKCVDKATALYTCYQTQVCVGADRVWTLDDLRVLAERHKKCGAEQAALRECSEKAK